MSEVMGEHEIAKNEKFDEFQSLAAPRPDWLAKTDM